MHLVPLNSNALRASASPKVLICDFLGCTLKTKFPQSPIMISAFLQLEVVPKKKKKKKGEEDRYGIAPQNTGVNWGSGAQSSPHVSQNPAEFVSSPCFALSSCLFCLSSKQSQPPLQVGAPSPRSKKGSNSPPAALHNQAQRISCIRLCCQAHFTPSRNQIRVGT